LGLLHEDQGKVAKKSIWQRKKSGSVGRPTLPDFSRSGGKVKKLGLAQIWHRHTDPMKGQLFAKKGVK
jgi:hypothetical protein